MQEIQTRLSIKTREYANPDASHRFFFTEGALSSGSIIYVVMEWRPRKDNPALFDFIEHETPYSQRLADAKIRILKQAGFSEVVKNV